MKVTALLQNKHGYPDKPPFCPAMQYPELNRVGIQRGTNDNPVYDAVRQTLAMLGLDKDYYGTSKWNPLGKFIHSGNQVVIKPNLVIHHRSGIDEEYSVTTHGSVIRAVIDYVFLALKGEGEIIIADTPLQAANFEKLVREAGLDAIQEFYDKAFGMRIEVLDLRNEWAVTDDESAYILERKRLRGDPNGYYEIDLGNQSELYPITQEQTCFSIGDYNDSVTREKHALNTHKYLFSGTILSADVVINLPKLKTHQKAGITCALKNCIGMNVSKDYLPHFRLGSPEMGGDEYPCKSYYNLIVSKCRKALQNRIPVELWKLARKGAFAFQNHVLGALQTKNSQSSYAIHGGAWYGNDTIWRTILDLNKLLFYADKNGVLQKEPQRKCLSIVDGIVAGEGEGPLKNTAKHCGLIICGEDSVAVDVVCARLMGFDENKIPQLSNSYRLKNYPITNYDGNFTSIQWLKNEALEQFLSKYQSFKFKPAAGWIGKIERY